MLRELDHGRLCSLANILYGIVETFPCKLGLPNYLATIYELHTLQSWTKSFEILHFRTADLVPLWPLPSSHPGQICLFGMKGNDPAGLQHCFFGGRGDSVSVVASALKLYLETRRSIIHFSQHFFQDCRYVSTEPVIQLFLLRF